jgi:hypothetical protein
MFATVVSLLGLGCGSDAPSQPAARDQASTAACNYYARCMEIGEGKTFVNDEDCMTQVKANFQTRWPPDQCTTISATGINNCVTAINIASCGNVQDIANVLLNKCTQANVCVATK